jgi:energy-coupling factor transport system ATP-binding protein
MSAIAAELPSEAARPARVVASLEEVTYRFPGQAEPALLDVTLDIEPGLTLIAGDSGSGKSTLLRLFDGLVPQFHGGRISGRARIDGLDTFRTPIQRLAQHAGLVFQDVETQSVYGMVEREIAFGLENLGTPRSEMHDQVDQVLAHFGIESLRGRRLETLSGGERQRVALAAVMVLRPSLVALDEPTSQLDPDGSAAVLAACRELADAGHAVVVAEHRHEVLLPAADRVIRMADGRTVEKDAGSLAILRVPRSRSNTGGAIAWHLDSVDAGPAGRPILRGISLVGREGEVVALTGANGSGKTTLLRTLAGLLPPLAGTVERPRGRTAYLPQNPGALLHLPTIEAEVALTLRRTDSGESAAEILRAFDLTELADRYPRDLSSGQRQRAALAATLAGSPSLALLDEPTRGMDAAARRSLAAAVRGLADRGSAVVIATHDAQLAADLADRILEIRVGGVAEREATR